MGINSRVFELIATHCRPDEYMVGIAELSRDDTGARALIAGYPDFLVDAPTIHRYLPGVEFALEPNPEGMREKHGWSGPLFDPHHVFRHLGYKLTIIDITAEHGEEKIVDLNKSILGDEDLPIGNINLYFDKGYDLVIDHGTIEHCFNIGVAALNLVSAVAEGGWMVQHLPFSMANHGFYNINPTWFYDLYEANGFEIVHFEGMRRDELYEFPRHARFETIPEALCTMIAKRVRAMPPTIPQQHIYRR